MKKLKINIFHSLISRLIFAVGLTLLAGVFTLAFLNVGYPKQHVIEPVASDTNRLADMIHFAVDKQIVSVAGLTFLVISAIIFICISKFVNNPINKLIKGTRLIAEGKDYEMTDMRQSREMGQLAIAINKMNSDIIGKQAELNKQRDEYQDLFERVPCLITVHDKKYRLIKYNREFSNKFDPTPLAYCYAVYKGRDKKCDNCPVEKTFIDGQSHYSEETGVNKDGTITHWIARTSAIRNTDGEIIAAIEMNLDITPSKQLESQLKRSEEKYYAIFNNIPNPVFVLDYDSLEILDCNQSVTAVYGFDRAEILHQSFLDFSKAEDKHGEALKIKSQTVINQAMHFDKSGKMIYVDIWISPYEYPDRKALLVTTSDITQRLEAEQQLIQTSKMATLGEMATGVAHELNQPLSVIKTASGFINKKIVRSERLDNETLVTLMSKIDGNIDRAANIISHMRQFARKSELELGPVHINGILKNAFEIFSQQLRLRGIEVIWALEDELPPVMGDAARLEQVFINLLVNARDAIEEKWDKKGLKTEGDAITIKTRSQHHQVIIDVMDTGMGISNTVIDKLFEPFFTTKEVGKGTGLGLSISYGIIEKCGGNIHVVHNRVEGAHFIIRFPVADS